MPRLAICDDDEISREILCDIIFDYCDQNPDAPKFEITEFSDAHSLLSAAGAAPFDLYLLDVLMPDITGMEAARALRAMGDRGHIVFQTCTIEFVLDAFDVSAAQYLLKPLEREKVAAVLESCFSSESATLFVKAASSTRKIELSNLLYISLLKHSPVYHLKGGEEVMGTSIRTRFKEAIVDVLSAPEFVLCGPALAINLACIRSIDGAEVRFVDGSVTYIPESRVRELRTAWQEEKEGVLK